MGVDFDKLPRHNNTYGYIDVGMAFSSKRDNVLARYIKRKPVIFINPAQIGGIWHQQILSCTDVSIFIIRKN